MKTKKNIRKHYLSQKNYDFHCSCYKLQLDISLKLGISFVTVL